MVKTPRCYSCESVPGIIGAAKAIFAGDAAPEQQKLFMAWLIDHACGYHDVAWEMDSDRTTSFEAGRRFVAIQIFKLKNLQIKESQDV